MDFHELFCFKYFSELHQSHFISIKNYFSRNSVTILFWIFILSQICDNFIFENFFVTDL